MGILSCLIKSPTSHAATVASIAHTKRASLATISDGLSRPTLSSDRSDMVPGTIFILSNEMLSRLADMLKPVDSLIHHNFSESCRRMLQFLVDDALTKHKVLSKLGISDNTPPQTPLLMSKKFALYTREKQRS